MVGQYTTCLNVDEIDKLISATARCRASAFSDRVAVYRNDREPLPGSGRIAVLVKQLIPADISLVAFSVNPITGSRQEIVINANLGLG